MTTLRFSDYAARAASKNKTGTGNTAKNNTFTADVVVIGTGAGGATVGAELAQAGLSVCFVEEGSWHPPSSFNPYFEESIPRLYRDAGATAALGAPPVAYLEGRCVGGSTVINGGMAYRAPDHVLADWQRIAGSDAIGLGGLGPYYDRVEGIVNATHQHDTSVGPDSQVMAAGAQKMGWNYSVNRRNQEACVGSNNCILGCPTGAKQSTLVSYMPKAMAAGATCLTEVRAEKLIIEGGRCVGVTGRGRDPRTQKLGPTVTVRGKAVVVACGAIHTPHLLLRHRIGRKSRQLGRNFTCHPNVKVLAVYPHDMSSWKGVSQYGQIREFLNEGILFAENFIPPAAIAAHLPMHGRKAWEQMKVYNNMVVSGVLVEDSSSGVVRRGPFGTPIVTYQITDHDHERFIKGVKLLSQMHFEMGAEYVMLPFNNLHYARSADDLNKIDPKKQTRKTLEMFTPHLMGTARMGPEAASSVVDLDGQAWDLPGCYVADASLFPTPIGVNPQITIMALATRVAVGILERQSDLRAAA